jgi:Lrp/AsnC family leucine-responsive transcriptional regulator
LLEVAPKLVGDRRARLREAGFIRKEKSVVDYRKLGLGNLLIISVSLKDRHPQRSRETAEWAVKFPNVQEVHHVTGAYDMVLKLRVRDVTEQRALLEHMAVDGNWDRTETMVVTGTVRESTDIEITEIEAAIIDGGSRRRGSGNGGDGYDIA